MESPRDEISGVRRPCSVDECSDLIDRESSDFGCCEKLVKIGDIEARRSCCECSSDKFRPELCVRIGGRDDPRSYGDIICGECRSNGDSGDLLREFVSEDVWDLVMSLKLTAIREKWPAICGHDPRDLLEDISWFSRENFEDCFDILWRDFLFLFCQIYFRDCLVFGDSKAIIWQKSRDVLDLYFHIIERIILLHYIGKDFFCNYVARQKPTYASSGVPHSVSVSDPEYWPVLVWAYHGPALLILRYPMESVNMRVSSIVVTTSTSSLTSTSPFDVFLRIYWKNSVSP